MNLRRTAPGHQPRLHARAATPGETALAGGQRVPKDCPRIEAYGTVDELNAFIGAARATLRTQSRALAELGRHPAARAARAVQPRLHPGHAAGGRASAAAARHRCRDRPPGSGDGPHERRSWQPLRSFVLPGGSRLNAELHVCRTVCRRAERACVALARAGTRAARSHAVPEPAERRAVRLEPLGQPRHPARPETLWEPNHSASGLPHNRDVMSEQGDDDAWREQRGRWPLGLTVLGAVARLLPHPPNFAPVGGDQPVRRRAHARLAGLRCCRWP